MTTMLFWAAAAATFTALFWLRQAQLVRTESRTIRSRLGIKGRWDDAFDVDDDELLLDPTIELPPRRSLVLVVGDVFDDSEYGKRLALMLRSADVPIKPSEGLAVLVLTAMLTYIIVEILFQQGPLINSIFALICGIIIPWLVLRSRRDRRLQKFTLQLPTIAELLANSLRAGLSLQGALEFVAQELSAPASEEIGILVREVRLGGGVDDALLSLEQRMPSSDLQVMVTALRVQRVAGGNLIKSMGELSRTLIERQRVREEIRTMMAEAKFTAYLMPILSVCALAILHRSQPGFLDVLFWTTPGWIVLTVFVIMQVIGFLLIMRFARIKV